MRTMENARGVLIIAFLLLAWCSSAFALNPALDVNQYAHTSWQMRDGFPKGQITSIAQTPDGYLWLGTEFGLVRFDGIKNVVWASSETVLGLPFGDRPGEEPPPYLPVDEEYPPRPSSTY